MAECHKCGREYDGVIIGPHGEHMLNSCNCKRKRMSPFPPSPSPLVERWKRLDEILRKTAGRNAFKEASDDQR